MDVQFLKVSKYGKFSDHWICDGDNIHKCHLNTGGHLANVIYSISSGDNSHKNRVNIRIQVFNHDYQVSNTSVSVALN